MGKCEDCIYNGCEKSCDGCQNVMCRCMSCEGYSNFVSAYEEEYYEEGYYET